MTEAVRSSAAMPQPVDPQRALGEAVRLRRMEKGVDLTQRALADRAGITVAHLSNLEKGRVNPTWGTMRSLAAALGLSLRELAVRTESLIEAEADNAPERGRPTG